MEEKNSFFEYAFEHSDYRHFPDEFKQWVFQHDKHILSFAWQKNSALLIPSHTGILPTEDDIEILKRFAKVFEQAYIRFMDLQKVEAQARESKIETALERVRARALAMQHPEELKEVAEVLRHEMGLLGRGRARDLQHLHQRCGGQKSRMLVCVERHSKKRGSFGERPFCPRSERYLGGQGNAEILQNKKRTGFHRDAGRGPQGMDRLPARNTPNRSKDITEKKFPPHLSIRGQTLRWRHRGRHPWRYLERSWRLLQRAASVISLAYSRFKDLTQARIDLQKLKTEKKRAEEALTELQLTQTQLIQSEKMACLGELTAGIAHEIQNPLNFVNNFAECRLTLSMN